MFNIDNFAFFLRESISDERQIVEFFNHWASQVEEFHSGNLETSIQDRVNYLTSKTLLKNVGLDEAQRAVVHNCCRLHRSILSVVSAEPEVALAFK